jgi:ATP-dependent DNA helicase RecQ
MQALDLLQKYWQHPAFRPGQEDIIQSVLNNRDTLALLPTGGGKSICFQIPALLNPGMAIVISPLIALMNDQVNGLKDKNIPAASVHSAMTYREIDLVLNNAIAGAYKFLYLSPERLITDMFRERLKHMKVNLLVIDEAHCISQWGYDFRPPYQRIAEVKEVLPDVPILALTATATPRVCDDIIRSLEMRQPVVFKNSFLRSNMHLIVRKEENKWQKLLDIMKAVQGSAIIYVRSRKGTKELARFLQRHRITADYYHAGLKTEQRAAVQQSWITGKIRVVACTNAFGMGIDKPDVRLVLHWDLPDSMEAYYQEAGRAGRDGKPCYAGIIYDQQDIADLKDSTSMQFPPVDEIRKTYQALGNYCQLATGAGRGQTFPFQFDQLLKVSGQHTLVQNYALKVLQQQGFVYLNESARNLSIIRVLVDHETLYRFQIENKKLEPLIKAILRNCPGVFEEHVSLRESEIAHFIGEAKSDVQKALQYLHKLELIEYQPSGDDPHITFLTERFSPDQLPLNTALLKSIKSEAMNRMHAMLEFVSGKPGCRMRKILTYFGENSENCGKCDHCVESEKHDLSDKDIERVYDWLSEKIKNQPRKMTELIADKPPLKKEKLMEAISYLTDNRWVRYTTDNELEWLG